MSVEAETANAAPMSSAGERAAGPRTTHEFRSGLRWSVGAPLIGAAISGVVAAAATAPSVAGLTVRLSPVALGALAVLSLVACAAAAVGALFASRFKIHPARDAQSVAGEHPLLGRDTGSVGDGRIAGGDCAALGTLLDGASLGFYSLDGEGRFVAVNQRFAQWLGATPREIVEDGASLRDFLAAPPTEEAPPWDPFGGDGEIIGGSAALTTRQSVDTDFRIDQCVTGSGAARRAWAIVRRLPGERALAASQSREHFLRFFADAPVGIAVISRSGVFTQANRALGELFDIGSEALIGRALVGFLNPDDRAAVAVKLTAAADGLVDRIPLEIRVRSPSERTVVLLLSPSNTLEEGSQEGGDRGTTASGGEAGSQNALGEGNSAGPDRAATPAAGLTLYFIDVTEQKHLETQFAQSQKMQAVGQLAGGVAHDFNNLLTAMIGFCDLLLLRARPGDPAFADIMQIKQNANRAANLVRQLLAFSRQQSLQPRVLDVTDVLVELSHLLRRLIGENIELEFVHGRELGLVKVDQGQLEQVVINLAVNARDAMPEGGRLTIRTVNAPLAQAERRGHETLPVGDYILIEVADTGIGIASDHLGRIFEPFFSTKKVGSGTGLGLSTVYGIVKQTGGFVFVDSAPGCGTTFAIYLPRHMAAENANFARPEVAEPAVLRDLTGTGTVMLVEDDDAVRMFGARALRNKGYRVIEAKSGEVALELIRDAADPIDLLITDVVMPQMDGPTLIREVRNIAPDITVIFISGYTEDTFRQRLDSDSDIHFLPKPFSLKELAVKVKDVIGSDFRGS